MSACPSGTVFLSGKQKNTVRIIGERCPEDSRTLSQIDKNHHAEKVDLTRNSVLLCMKKYKEGGVENAIFDAPARGRNAEIKDEEKP